MYYYDYYIISMSCRILVLKLVLFWVYWELNVIEDFFIINVNIVFVKWYNLDFMLMKMVFFLILIYRYGIILFFVKLIFVYVIFDYKFVFIVRFLI